MTQVRDELKYWLYVRRTHTMAECVSLDRQIELRCTSVRHTEPGRPHRPWIGRAQRPILIRHHASRLELALSRRGPRQALFLIRGPYNLFCAYPELLPYEPPPELSWICEPLRTVSFRSTNLHTHLQGDEPPPAPPLPVEFPPALLDVWQRVQLQLQPLLLHRARAPLLRVYRSRPGMSKSIVRPRSSAGGLFICYQVNAL